jgi:hypothetical protein
VPALEVAPNILWSLGSSVHNQFLQVGRGNPAVVAAKISLNSLLERQIGKTPGAPKATARPTRPGRQAKA